MTALEKQVAAAKFAARWKDRGYEKGESQVYWLSLLSNVLGVEDVDNFIRFEEQVVLDHTSFIDARIPSTKVLIEQKSIDKDLRAPIKQSDGTWLTPVKQAKRYSMDLPYSQRPRWIVTCNFKEFLIYDMEYPRNEPDSLLLENLENEFYRLNFLVDTGDENVKRETKVSLQAGEIVGKLYDAILKQYKNPESLRALKSLNALCVRLVFCYYAEDAGVFGKHKQFHDYLNAHRAEDRLALIRLFQVLNQKPEERDPYLEEDLAAFPYVNGGLFADEAIEIPRLGDEIIDIILGREENFNWSEISPTIFGAVFESTLHSKARRSGGMHYTSIENIHKVIDPLFLNDLRAELDECKNRPVAGGSRTKALQKFKSKLASLKFLDPACGSGNFLTETYLSLRRMENEIIRELMSDVEGQTSLENIGTDYLGVEVSISQFYGIEINDFAVTVARTALWIAESQMLQETEKIIQIPLDFLPLKTAANITEGNALRLDWETIVSKRELSYIIGNPPFAGRRYRTPEQTKDLELFFSYKDIDYVACWYKKAAQYINGSNIEVAFVSTNSITQGEQVPVLWADMLELSMVINFAYKTFVWSSEAKQTAHVYCVIIGFSHKARTKKFLYSGNIPTKVTRINGYLLDAPDVFISSRKTPLCPVPKMQNGNVPLDGDALKIEAADYPKFKGCPYVKKLIGGTEMLYNKERYVLWLVDVSPSEIRKDSRIMDRVTQCRENRLAMKDKSSQKLALTPTTFRDTNNPDRYIALPMVSSENREYIPMAYYHDDTIPTNQVQIIPYANLYHLGVLSSNVHMAWMRAVCGRLEMRYRYSKDVVYNNFPWPTPTKAQKAQIEKTAQAILDTRALYPDSTLADLYDVRTMPAQLHNAHVNNDKAVLEAYGFTKGHPARTNENACVAELMKLYQKLIEK